MISYSMLKEWEAHPVTIKLLKRTQTEADSFLEHIASGETLSNPTLAARLVGRLDVLRWLLRIEDLIDREPLEDKEDE
jgi:hypothetical protein